VEKFFNPWDGEVHQESAVKQQTIPVPPLSVAGEFQIFQGEIGVAGDFNRFAYKRAQKLPVPSHHKAICAADACAVVGVLNSQKSNNNSAPRPLQNGPAAAAPSKDGICSAAQAARLTSLSALFA